MHMLNLFLFFKFQNTFLCSASVWELMVAFVTSAIGFWGAGCFTVAIFSVLDSSELLANAEMSTEVWCVASCQLVEPDFESGKDDRTSPSSLFGLLNQRSELIVNNLPELMRCSMSMLARLYLQLIDRPSKNDAGSHVSLNPFTT